MVTVLKGWKQDAGSFFCQCYDQKYLLNRLLPINKILIEILIHQVKHLYFI